MKNILLAASSLLALTAAASAADLPSRAAPSAYGPAPVFAQHNWSGFYVGAVGTIGMMTNDFSDHWCDVACDSPQMGKWGGGIGGTVGFNMQSGSFVYGVEGDLSWVNFKNQSTFNFDDNNGGYSEHYAKWNSYGTLRGRVGMAVNNTMMYVTGGVAFVGVKYGQYYMDNQGWDGGFAPLSKTETGFAIGAGVEHAFTPNWSLKAEYLYIGLPSRDGGVYCNNRDCTSVSSPDDRILYRSSAHTARVGLNYKFGWGGAATTGPVVAAY